MYAIATPRLALRRWHPTDAAPLYAMNQDPRVLAFLPGPMSMQQVEAFMASQNATYDACNMGYLAATLAATGELIGFVGLRQLEAGLPCAPCVEIGWRLAARHWGNGYATEAARAWLLHGFAQLALEEIVSFTVPGNLASRRVMERLGMRRDEHGDFAHPAVAPEHRLSRHVLYRLARHEAPAS